MKISLRNKIFIFLTIVLALGLLYWSYEREQAILLTSGGQASFDVVDKSIELNELHDVSLATLMQKDFNGRELTLDAVLDEKSLYSRYHITYKSGELVISGVMNVPKSEIVGKKFPVLILNHGHIDTAIYTNGRGLRREQDYLARNGYVVLHPDYRNHAQSDRDDRDELVVRLGYVEDVINAVLAVQNSDLDFVDKEKIGMLGHSMGGGITLSVLTVAPDLVDAAVLYAPVSGDMRDSYYRWIESRVPAAEKIAQLYGKPEENPTFWDGLAAQNYYENIRAPIEIYHGTADESVPIDWSKNTEKLLIDSGKAVKLIVFDDAPHEFTRDWQNFMDSTKIFYDSLLK